MLINDNAYFEILNNIKKQIHDAQYRAVLCVNQEQKVQSLLALLSWTHNLRIMDTVKTPEQYEWYAKQTIENGWSVRLLEYHIETKGYARQALPQSKASNYQRLLPSPQSDLAVETLKSAYVFDLAEYALKDINKPIGVSEYQLSDFVPAEYLNTLPSAEDIEKRVKARLDINDMEGGNNE